MMNATPSDQERWFAEEIQPHEPALRAYLRSRFPEVRDVDDLVQESFTRVLQSRGTVKSSAQSVQPDEPRKRPVRASCRGVASPASRQ